MQIQEKPKFDTPFAWIGGEANIQALVERFYDLMDLEPGYTVLRAARWFWQIPIPANAYSHRATTPLW